MPAILVDYVRRAAEALVAANRAEDPEAGTRLRQTAYDLLERAREREEALRRANVKAEGADAAEAPIRRAEPPLSSKTPERSNSLSVLPIATGEVRVEQDKSDRPEGPLSSEALKRDEWRGEGGSLRPEDAPGHSLPESERDATADQGGAAGPNPMAGTMLPPD